MEHRSSTSGLSRRTALAGIGAGGLGWAVAAATVARPAMAQDDDLAHPLAGTWQTLAGPMLPETPMVPHISRFAVDGTCTLFAPLSDFGPDGPFLQTPYVGIWKPYDERRGQFRASQTVSDLEGHVTGGVTVDGFPLVSEDGLSFEDDGSMVQITIWDPSGAIIDSFPGGVGRPVRGRRLTFENLAFPEPLANDGTPTS
ncbi:MAG: hypothetical protein IT335_09315 [Thermomicrobiales bacterium]|jgi:hypothetical protein|nr:hypothetical protein [Thermomicrobiales bacterium]